MNCIAKVCENIFWVGGNDRRLNLFENVYPIPQGISYNSYVIVDEKTVLMDTADAAIGDLFMENIEAALGGRKLDYVVVNHMEPDHCATLERVCLRYPEAVIIGNAKTAAMIGQFFDTDFSSRIQLVKEGDSLVTGSHTFRFYMAAMVHWPEVMVTYDETAKTLFSADAFGTFGAVSGFLFADEVDFEHEWLPEARRYYANIVGKYGAQVQALLKKTAQLEIEYLCPLHGPVWRENISWYVEKYDRWSTWTPEEDGVLVAYGTVYNHTANAAEIFAMALRDAGVKKIAMYDATLTHPSYIVSEAFRFGKLALLSSTYNGGIFPAMETVLLDLKAHMLKNRTVALAENGSWGPTAGRQMRELLGTMKDMNVLEPTVSIRSALKDETRAQLEALACELAKA